MEGVRYVYEMGSPMLDITCKILRTFISDTAQRGV
jgi:hypothetical protein